MYKINGGYFHILRENDNLNMQRYFIFVDTETNTEYKDNKEILSLKLGWSIFYDNITKQKEYFYFENVKDFWIWFFKITKDLNDIYFYAHNTDFDFKILDGLNTLIKEYDYLLQNFYVEGHVFILNFKNNDKKIHIWDTMNYIPLSLKEIGLSIGLNKQEIDFKNCSNEKLKEYCKNDVEIIFKFITLLIEFLEKYELSKLKPTTASLSLNIFRHKFYDKKEKPIYIHNWINAIELERLSYRGGICDCLKIGKFKEKLYKLDINSMYPFIMKNYDLPTKLIHYSDLNTSNLYKLKNNLFKAIKDKKLVIAHCKIYLPKEYSYIIVKCKQKSEKRSLFLSGYFEGFFTSPEIEFILKYGKILSVKAISIYEKSNLFNDFVDFFYNKRNEFKKEGNLSYALFCKYILNSLYGKFGQTKLEYNKLIELDSCDIKSQEVYFLSNDNTLIKENQIQMGNTVFSVMDTDNNSFDTFVAIPSFITAYARMYLIELLLLANRKNTYYCDTDCLIVNQEGLDNLQSYIHKDKLGFLKLEESSGDSEFLNAKHYKFNHSMKIKGVSKNAILLEDNKKESIYIQKQFERFKTSLKNGNMDKQIITDLTKHIDKIYKKGIIKNNNVIPFYLERG